MSSHAIRLVAPWRPGARFRTNFVFYGFIFAMAAHFSVAYTVGTKSYLNLVAYENGLAKLPFQYRVLTAGILRLFADSSGFVRLAHHLSPPFDQPEVLGLTIINLIAVVLVTDIVRRLIALYVDDFELASCLCFLMPVSMYFSYVALANTYKLSFPYDIPNLPIFAGCLYLIFTRQIRWLYPLFVIACLSRETSLFLIAIYVLHEVDRARSERLTVAANSFVLFIIWFTVKLGLFAAFPHNSLERGAEVGGVFTLRLEQNLNYLVEPQYWPNILSSGGFLWIVVLVTRRFVPPGPLRRTLWVFIPWILSMLVVALFTEVRIFGELTILLSVVAAVGAYNFLKSRGLRSREVDPSMA